ncbi:cation diffusion facilitator family transporter [Ereboglobus sp. PH5-5]|uniref:cation diffusion facilitator family transporter n=1 Tax=Ereboglobus sp. PH5-5 TaxID=2940529 RepID=UPI0024053D08|nr:cation diffusion facilitator family transporter [Ereboglobus sp. PH5-5]MDF9833299.1 cation diffusion facilitator family transporter [Ereboglobus sp. PH5-5]
MEASHTHAAVRKERVARWSIVASAVITVGKLLAGLFSGSLALLSEAAHALVDTFATTVTWFAIRASNKPADDEHQYGHAKFESVAALVETGILFLLALAVLVQAAGNIFSGGHIIEATPLVFAIVIASILIDLNRIRALRKVARDTGSQALAADVLHFSSDMAGSVLVLLGLIASRFGFLYGDAIAALGVAGFIAVAGWRLGRRTLDTLLDAAPKGRVARLRTIASAEPGVLGTSNIRLRAAGHEVFGEMTLMVARTLSMEQASAIRTRVLAAIRKEFPDTMLTVTTSPVAPRSETVRERVTHIAYRRGLAVHHVTVQDIGAHLSISFDLELDGRMSLGEAHETAESLKAEIRAEFGAGTEVEPHIEPLEVKHLPGQNAPPETVIAITRLLEKLAAQSGSVSGVHNVRVRQTPGGLVVNYHCRAAASLDVAHAHRLIDEIEHHARDEYPAITRIVGHTDLLK